MLNLSSPFHLIILLLYLASGMAGQAAELFDTLHALHQYCTKEVPERIRLLAVTELTDQGWTEAMVLAELKNQESLMKDMESTVPREEKEKLREARINMIRKVHSGHKWMVQREWRSGELYRLDQTEVFGREPTQEDMDAEFYEKQFVNIDDSKFNPAASFWANHRNKSATVDLRNESKWKRSQLWTAGTMEPQLALPLIAVLSSKKAPPPKSGNLADSFAGFEFDLIRANELIQGKNPDWLVSMVIETVDSIPSIKVELTSRKGSESEGVAFSYWLDAATKRKLIKAEGQNASEGGRIICSRRRFGLDGFPREWSTELHGQDGAHSLKKVEFVAVDNFEELDDHNVFFPSFPEGYLVFEVAKNGTSKPIQNPLNASASSSSVSSGQGLSRNSIALAVFLICALGLPLILLIRSKSTGG